MARVQTTATDEALVARMQTVVAQSAEELIEEIPGGFDIFLAPLSWWRKNWADKNVQKKFIENFIKIRSKYDKNVIVPFRLNDLQNDIHFNRTGRDIYLKFRQGGVSTYFLALNLCRAILFSGRNIKIAPHDTEAEDELWKRIDTMYQNLPSKLRPSTKYYSKEEIEIRDVSKDVVDSRIVCIIPRAGKEGKFRALSLTDVHITELPRWEGNQEETFTAILDAVGEGNIAIESTAQGKEKFHFYYHLGKKKGSGWKSHFYEWYWLRENRKKGFRFAQIKDKWCLLSDEQSSLDIWNPYAETELDRIERQQNFDTAKITKEEKEVCQKILEHLQRLKYVGKDETWHCWEVAEYLAWRRAKIIDYAGNNLKHGLKIFLVENPENDKDCFESSARTVISPEFLKVTCEPIKIPDADSSEKQFAAFAEKIKGKSFIVAADTSLGRENSDPAAIEIIDVDTGRQCHSEELLISPDLLAYRLQELSDWFNAALICVERNNTGIATLKELTKLVEAERIFKELTQAQRRQVEDGKKSYDEAMLEAEFGIATTTANKALFAIFIEQGVRTGELGLSNQAWCDQAETVIWLNSNKTQWGAMPGFHDDRFIALAIANFVRVSRYAEFMGFVGILPEGGYAR